MLHRLLGLHPRPPTAGPPRTRVQRDLQSKPPRLAHGMPKHPAPLRAHEFHRTPRNPDIHLHQDHAAQSRPVHRLKVRRDSLAADIAVHPEPIDPGPRGIGRLVKSPLEPFTPALGVTEGRRAEKQGGQQGRRAEVSQYREDGSGVGAFHREHWVRKFWRTRSTGSRDATWRHNLIANVGLHSNSLAGCACPYSTSRS